MRSAPTRSTTLTDATGVWTLRFVLLTLAITPLRRLTGWNVLIRFRRMLGLFAFFYGTLHFTTWIPDSIRASLGLRLPRRPAPTRR